MDSIVVALAFLLRHPILVTSIMILSATLGQVLYSKIFKRNIPVLYSFFVVAFLIFYFFFAPDIVNSYIYNNGEEADAVITKYIPTNIRVNKRNLFQYEVIINYKGEKIMTYFEDFPKPLYGKNKELYQFIPSTGQPFKVKFLKGYPQFLVILTDANSEFNRYNECLRLLQEYNRIKIMYENFPDTNNLNNYIKILDELSQIPCESMFPKEFIEIELEELKKKKLQNQ